MDAAAASDDDDLCSDCDFELDTTEQKEVHRVQQQDDDDEEPPECAVCTDAV